MSDIEVTSTAVNVKSSLSVTRRKHGSNCTASLNLDQTETRQHEASTSVAGEFEDSEKRCILSPTTSHTQNGVDFFTSLDNVTKKSRFSSPLSSEMKLMTYNDLPSWMQDNDFIKCGYRPQLASYSSCLKSVCGIHTETGNIWTHLIGCSIFVALAPYTLYMHHGKLTYSDQVIFAVYFLSTILCLAFSTIYHIFTCHSEHVAQMCKRFDYCGISILITGSIVAWVYYAFYHDSTIRSIYLSIVTIVGFSVAVVSLLKKFGSSEFRSIRTTIYIIYGVSAALPVIHYFFSDNYVDVPFFPLFTFGALYILGGVLYANRIPEKFSPGKFDIYCHSHQIFHILVVLAAWLHLLNIRYIALQRIDTTGTISSE